MSNEQARRVHFIGVCGKAMGGIAAALAEEGWHVTGSDADCYEPMRSYVRARGVRILSRNGADGVPPEADVVVVGKRVALDNPELPAARRRGSCITSSPAFLAHEFLPHSRNAVVAGGVGKTTTAAMLTWILEYHRRNPNYLIGGPPRNLRASARFGCSHFAVLEGDEYPSCFDDPRPKFLHYRPEVAVITNILEDHPDIYRSFDQLVAAFSALARSIPSTGLLVLPDNDEAAAHLTNSAKCETLSVGFSPDADVRISVTQLSSDWSCFIVGTHEFELPMCGEMNMRNAAMAAVAAKQFGISLPESAKALRSFCGVRNRQEEKDAGDCILVRDKASHPRALTELAGALRQRFPGRRLVSLVQPRATGGRDWVYQRELPAALAHFDQVILTNPREYKAAPDRPWAKTPFCVQALAFALAERGVPATFAEDEVEIRCAVEELIEPADVLLLTILEQSEDLVRLVTKILEERDLTELAMLPAA